METTILIAAMLTAMAALTATALEYRRDLMMFQQNSYRIDRYRRWLQTSGDTTSMTRLGLLVAFFAMMWLKDAWWWCLVLLLPIMTWRTWRLATSRYKKPLVMTRRAWRLMSVMTLLEAVVVAAGLIGCPNFWQGAAMGLCAAYLLSHIIVVVSATLLKPVEHAINARYRRDAERILASMPDLKIVGVTGSYGKTSTKHYLQRILSEKYDTLMTPGSYNTTLGVIRTIRENLKPYNEVFVVEMGAKQPGDIRDICDLVKPTIGIVTAVGEQHLESFGSIENVQRTKFELIDALPGDGLAVVNDDFPYAASRPVTGVETVRYAVSNPAAATVTAKDITYDPTGTTFTVCGLGGDLRLHTRLVGECNISNLLAAVVVAKHLGVDDEKIRYAVERIEQVEHRLNVKRIPGGLTIIDDAFNSNPTGSAMALDVLCAIKGGRRIVVTPGMIELGDRQHELNRQFGEKIAACADVAIIVGAYNRDAIMEGISATRPDDPDVHTAANFAEAQRLLATVARPGDTVLYENDLPDTFK